MAIPTFVTASAKAAGTTSATPALPASMLPGDVVVLVATTDFGNTPSISVDGSVTPWTSINDGEISAGEHYRVWWGRWISGATGPTITGVDHVCAATFAYRGVLHQASAGDTILDSNGAGTDSVSNTAYSFATGETTAYPDTLIINVYTSGVDSNVGQSNTNAPTNANLSGVTMRAEYNTNMGGGGGFVLADGGLKIPGAVGTWADTMVTATTKAHVSFGLRAFQLPPMMHTKPAPYVIIGGR